MRGSDTIYRCNVVEECSECMRSVSRRHSVSEPPPLDSQCQRLRNPLRSAV